MNEKAPQLEAVDELQSDVHSEQDQAVLDAWKAEIEQERQETLQPLPNLAIRPNGTVDTVENIQKDAQNGQGDHPYGDAGRRA